MVVMGSSDGYDATSVTNYQPQQQQQTHHQTSEQVQERGLWGVMMQKLERWVFLYNVTTGLYMLDWWERCIFNAVFLVFFLVACYNSGQYLCRLGAGLVAWCGGDDAGTSYALGGGFGKGCSVVMEWVELVELGVEELGFGASAMPVG